jgi:hypothetical protein
MWNQDLSLGVDISDQHISAVLLSRRHDKISVVKTASQNLASSASGGDGIKTAQTVGRAIRQLLFRAGIRRKKAWVSFGSQGLLLQMIDMPEPIPTNLGQYIRRQIRNSSQLNSKNPCLDFAAMAKKESQGVQQCLVAAVDSQQIETLIKSLSLASIHPQVIDIPVMALCRALYKKRLSQEHTHHTLLFYLHGRDVYLAVLHKSNVDYVRHVERISEDEKKPFELWAVDQIRAVIQYYETEFIAKGKEEELSWQFIMASDNPAGDAEKLKGNIEKSFSGAVIFLNHENAETWLPIEKNPNISNLPLGATGAALGKWADFSLKTEIDLLPEQNRRICVVTEYFMNTLKMAAAVLLLMLLFAYGLSVRVNAIQSDPHKNGRVDPQKEIEQLQGEKESLVEQLVVMGKQKKQVETLIGGYSVGYMAELLDQIRQHTPAVVCMTQLWSSSKGVVEIEGYCPTMEDIQSYARLLETAAYVKSAQVRLSEVHPKNPNLRYFTITCTLKEGI